MRTILIAATIAFIPLGAASASSIAEKATVRVPVTSADLQSEEGLAALVERIEDAAYSVCRRTAEGAPLIAGGRQACAERAAREAIFDAKIEPLTHYYSTVKGIAPPRAMSATLASR